VSLWALILGTTVTTALWLEGRSAKSLAGWELLRLGCLGLLLLLAWQSGSSGLSLTFGAVYGGLNLLFLRWLSRMPPADDTALTTSASGVFQSP
jgi:alkylglycerol monooxygenase